MSEGIHEHEIAAIEAVLSSFAPAPLGIDRDRLMFSAGQAATGRPSRFWPCATAATSLLSVVLGTTLWAGSGAGPRIKSTGPALPGDAEAGAIARALLREPGRPVSGDSGSPYLKLRDAVLARGIAALPSPPADGRSTKSYWQSLRDLERSNGLL